jgi:hypothetical protein
MGVVSARPDEADHASLFWKRLGVIAWSTSPNPRCIARSSFVAHSEFAEREIRIVDTFALRELLGDAR